MGPSKRSLEREHMDDHVPSQAVVDEVYRFLGAINRWFGGTHATINRFDEFSRGWEPGALVTVLDVACGGGDLARALVAWGRSRGFDLRVTALDISVRTLDCARRRGRADDRLRFVCGDLHQAPCLERTFDYVCCSLFFHHLTDDDVVLTLRAFDRLARRGIVVNDLVRSWRHLFWSWLLTRPFNEVLRQDGPLSVRRAFTPPELVRLIERSGVNWLSVDTHFGHRVSLAGERPRGGMPTDVRHHTTSGLPLRSTDPD